MKLSPEARRVVETSMRINKVSDAERKEIDDLLEQIKIRVGNLGLCL